MTGFDEQLRADLVAMYADDQGGRALSADRSQEAMRAAWTADKARAARLNEIVALHGWPLQSLVGEDGARAAWIIAQHGDHDPALQERMLALLTDAVERGEASVKHVAYLTDRVCVNRDRPQIYGTQFGGSAETYGPQPIADHAGLDERRAGVGLEPFERYERHMREIEAQHRAGGAAMTTPDGARETTFSTPSDRELAVTRVFDAPRAVVFDAWTKPARITDWMLGPEGWTMPVCDVDLRDGGAWRFGWRSAEGREMSMDGVYREVVAPERLIFTETWGGGWPPTLNTVILEEEDGKTRLTCTVEYVSTDARAAAFSTGMSEGMTQSLDRLAAHLASDV